MKTQNEKEYTNPEDIYKATTIPKKHCGKKLNHKSQTSETVLQRKTPEPDV